MYSKYDLAILEGDHLYLSSHTPSHGDIVVYIDKEKVHIDIFSNQKSIVGVVDSLKRKIS